MPTLPPPHRDELKTGTVPGPCKQARIGTRQLDDCLSHVVDTSDDAKLISVTVTRYIYTRTCGTVNRTYHAIYKQVAIVLIVTSKNHRRIGHREVPRAGNWIDSPAVSPNDRLSSRICCNSNRSTPRVSSTSFRSVLRTNV